MTSEDMAFLRHRIGAKNIGRAYLAAHEQGIEKPTVEQLEDLAKSLPFERPFKECQLFYPSKVVRDVEGNLKMLF